MNNYQGFEPHKCTNIAITELYANFPPTVVLVRRQFVTNLGMIILENKVFQKFKLSKHIFNKKCGHKPYKCTNIATPKLYANFPPTVLRTPICQIRGDLNEKFIHWRAGNTYQRMGEKKSSKEGREPNS